MTTIDALKVASRVVRSACFWILYAVIVKCMIFARMFAINELHMQVIIYFTIFSSCVFLGLIYRLEFFSYTLEQIGKKDDHERVV